MTLVDSAAKTITQYITAVAAEPITYNGTTYPVKALRVSPSVFREFTCHRHCGACCRSWNLYWTDAEGRPDSPHLQPHALTLNGRTATLWEDPQHDPQAWCRYLEPRDASCRIHALHPLSCDMPPIMFKHARGQAEITGQLYTRGWAMQRLGTTERGALCEIGPPSPARVGDFVRKFRRLRDWCDLWGIANRCDAIIRWAGSGDNVAPLRFAPALEGGLFG